MRFRTQFVRKLHESMYYRPNRTKKICTRGDRSWKSRANVSDFPGVVQILSLRTILFDYSEPTNTIVTLQL